MRKLLFIALMATIGAAAQKQHANGDGAVASAYYSTAVGDDAKATVDHATAVGRAAQATAYKATALGDNARAIATNSTALGRDALTQGKYSTAVGESAKTGANATGAIQLGTGENFDANTVQFGNGSGMRVKGVANGVNATDAVNKSQLDLKADKTQVATDIAKAKTEAITASNSYTDTKVANETTRAKAAESALNDKIDLNAETAKLYTDSSIQATETKLNKRIDALEFKFDQRINGVLSYVSSEFNAVNNRIEGLGASMVALSAAATSSVYNANKPTNLNIATGVYGNGYAIAGGLSHFFNSSTKVSVNYSKGSNTKNAVGVGFGIAF